MCDRNGFPIRLCLWRPRARGVETATWLVVEQWLWFEDCSGGGFRTGHSLNAGDVLRERSLLLTPLTFIYPLVSKLLHLGLDMGIFSTSPHRFSAIGFRGESLTCPCGLAFRRGRGHDGLEAMFGGRFFDVIAMPPKDRTSRRIFSRFKSYVCSGGAILAWAITNSSASRNPGNICVCNSKIARWIWTQPSFSGSKYPIKPRSLPAAPAYDDDNGAHHEQEDWRPGRCPPDDTHAYFGWLGGAGFSRAIKCSSSKKLHNSTPPEPMNVNQWET